MIFENINKNRFLVKEFEESVIWDTIKSLDKGNNPFSPFMDTILFENMLPRVVSNAFIKAHNDVLKKETVCYLELTIGEANLTVTVTYLENKLNGFVYNLIKN